MICVIKGRATVRNRDDAARSLIRVLIDANHFFETRETDTLALIKKHCTKLLQIQNDQEWDYFYNTRAASLEAKLYPRWMRSRMFLPWRSSEILR